MTRVSEVVKPGVPDDGTQLEPGTLIGSGAVSARHLFRRADAAQYRAKRARADPDRLQRLWRDRLAAALEEDPENPGPLLDALEMIYSGGLVYAGMGHMTYEQTSERLVAAAHLLMEK